MSGDYITRFGLAGVVWRSAVRAPLRLAALFLLLALISFFLTTAELLQSGIGEAADRGAKRLGADLMVVPAGEDIQVGRGLFGGVPVRFALPQGAVRAVAAAPGVKAVAPQYFLFAARSSCCDTGKLLLVGFDPARDFTVLPWIRGGRGDISDDRSVVAGGAVRKAEGAELRFHNRRFIVAGRLEKSGLGYFDNAVFIPTPGLAATERASLKEGAVPFNLPWERPSILLALVSPGVDPERTAALLQQQVPGIRVLTMPQLFREKKELVARLAAWRTPVTTIAWLLAMTAGFAVRLPWWRERRPLLGLLRACGIGRWALVRLFALETLLLCAAAMAAGGVMALLLLRFAAPSLVAAVGLPFSIEAGALYAVSAPRLWLIFTGAMTLEAVCMLFLLLRSEPADLVRRG